MKQAMRVHDPSWDGQVGFSLITTVYAPCNRTVIVVCQLGRTPLEAASDARRVAVADSVQHLVLRQAADKGRLVWGSPGPAS